MELNEEEKLVREAQRVKGGQNAPFGKLYQAYYPKIKTYFVSRLGTEPTAEDLTSLTFQKALSGLASFKWQGVPFSSWLLTIARNTFFDHLRSPKGKKQVEIESAYPVPTKSPTQMEELLEREEHDWLGKELAKLAPRERDIIYLKFYEGLTNRQIAQFLDLTETNVGTILYRTLTKIRQEAQSA
ncbi:MAG: RNA polymerase sigma factor [Patescibacteria group bacterium]